MCVGPPTWVTVEYAVRHREIGRWKLNPDFSASGEMPSTLSSHFCRVGQRMGSPKGPPPVPWVKSNWVPREGRKGKGVEGM